MARRDEQRGDRRNRNDEERDSEIVEKLVHINRVAATVKGNPVRSVPSSTANSRRFASTSISDPLCRRRGLPRSLTPRRRW